MEALRKVQPGVRGGVHTTMGTGTTAGDRSLMAAAWPERADPDPSGPSGHNDLEHLSRYEWAASLITGGVVLDAACGTGYGSAMLATRGDVKALDKDEEARAMTAARVPAAQVGHAE